MTTDYESLEEELYHDPHAWRDYANCLGATEEDERLLFPWESDPEPEDNETDFYMINHCFGCPVRRQCLDFAAETASVGIWGGFRIDFDDAEKLQGLHSENGSVSIEEAEQLLREDRDEPD